MEYYSAYAMVLYSLGIRAAFYMVLIRFSSSREQWYPDKMVNCCCTQARNALGLFSVGSEIVDAGLALFCGSDLYLARRAVGDGITLARYAAKKRTRNYGLFVLLGATIWSLVNCGIYGSGAVLHFVSGLASSVYQICAYSL